MIVMRKVLFIILQKWKDSQVFELLQGYQQVDMFYCQVFPLFVNTFNRITNMSIQDASKFWYWWISTLFFCW
jgi:hypothetical protein